MGFRDPAAIKALYSHIDRTCLVMIDRSMWFGKSYEALAVDDFKPLVQKHANLAGKQWAFREPLTYALSYAQRVFLCSAMELCLLHQHSNSVLLLTQLWPTKIRQLTHLLDVLRSKRKVKTWDEWNSLSWDARLEILRGLSFSSLQAATGLFGDIYGPDCFELAWGCRRRDDLQQQYKEYQSLRNGIVHRGGELSSGAKIEATDRDMETTLQDAKRFRDAILQLSKWCLGWWLDQVTSAAKCDNRRQRNAD